MAIQTPYKAPFSTKNARVTARHNIQYAADDASCVFELVSTDPETLSALQALYAGPLLRRFSRRIREKTPKFLIIKIIFIANRTAESSPRTLIRSRLVNIPVDAVLCSSP